MQRKVLPSIRRHLPKVAHFSVRPFSTQIRHFQQPQLQHERITMEKAQIYNNEAIELWARCKGIDEYNAEIGKVVNSHPAKAYCMARILLDSWHRRLKTVDKKEDLKTVYYHIGETHFVILYTCHAMTMTDECEYWANELLALEPKFKELDLLNTEFYNLNYAMRMKVILAMNEDDFKSAIKLLNFLIDSRIRKALKKITDPQVKETTIEFLDDLLQRRSYSFFCTGNLDKAIEDISEAIELSGHQPKLYMLRSRVYFAAKRDAEGEADVDFALQKSNNDPEIERDTKLSRAMRMAYNRKLDEALSMINEVILKYPETADAYLGRARIYQELCNYENALQDCRMFEELAPLRILEISTMYSECLARCFKYDEWVELAERMMGNAELVYRYEEKVLVEFFTAKINIHFLRGEYESAISFAEAEIKKLSDQTEVVNAFLFNIAYLCVLDRQFDRAKSVLAKIKEPTEPLRIFISILTWIAQAALKYKKDFVQEAPPVMTKMVADIMKESSRQSDSARVFEMLGIGFYYSGDYAMALFCFGQVINATSRPESLQIAMAYSAKAQHALGNKESAAILLKTALKLSDYHRVFSTWSFAD